MALQTPVITSTVTVPQKSLFIVTFQMVVADDTAGFDGITTTESIKVRPGDVVDAKVAPVIVAFQKEIDDYKAAKAIRQSAAMSDAITAIGEWGEYIMADITATGQVITDWTAVAQNTIAESGVLDISDDLKATLLLQAFLDSETAHTGTKIIVEVSWNLSGDEDWYELTQRTIFASDTANEELIDDNPLTAGSTTILMSSTTGFTVDGELRGIKDGTIANSEIVRQIAETTNTDIDILDGTANEHANTVNIYSVAYSRPIASLTEEIRRVRVVIDNTFDPDGSTLVYKLAITRATDIV